MFHLCCQVPIWSSTKNIFESLLIGNAWPSQGKSGIVTICTNQGGRSPIIAACNYDLNKLDIQIPRTIITMLFKSMDQSADLKLKNKSKNADLDSTVFDLKNTFFLQIS